jgi:hypothetical protein
MLDRWFPSTYPVDHPLMYFSKVQDLPSSPTNGVPSARRQCPSVTDQPTPPELHPIQPIRPSR